MADNDPVVTCCQVSSVQASFSWSRRRSLEDGDNTFSTA